MKTRSDSSCPAVGIEHVVVVVGCAGRDVPFLFLVFGSVLSSIRVLVKSKLIAKVGNF